jgi:hypothetical protein
LRLLIHYLGDLHQPLHAAEAFSIQFPNGDRGGNSWNISSGNPNITQLHALWDS